MTKVNIFLFLGWVVKIQEQCSCNPIARIRNTMTTLFQGVVFGLLVARLIVGPATAEVTEPDGYRLTDFRGPVPETLSGAQVVTSHQARQLWSQSRALFIDVMPQAPRPKGLPLDTLWREKTRDNIPGSYWLANVGYGRLHPAAANWFKKRLKMLTGGNKNKPVLFYCLMNCWMSWNAAKRALEYGYSNVLWFPDGTDGWSFENFPLKRHYPDMYIE